ncbi:hypothetical protein LTR17_005242 [Elasticomyces elasticus]|nr:hypothetical protein LTR17_005242 [Elasticomyces elasticus]
MSSLEFPKMNVVKRETCPDSSPRRNSPAISGGQEQCEFAEAEATLRESTRDAAEHAQFAAHIQTELPAISSSTREHPAYAPRQAFRLPKCSSPSTNSLSWFPNSGESDQPKKCREG